MKLNEYINLLTELLNKEGNLEVKLGSYIQCTPNPGVRYMRINNKRQTKLDFWSSYDLPEQKGEKVIRL